MDTEDQQVFESPEVSELEQLSLKDLEKMAAKMKIDLKGRGIPRTKKSYACCIVAAKHHRALAPTQRSQAFVAPPTNLGKVTPDLEGISLTNQDTSGHVHLDTALESLKEADCPIEVLPSNPLSKVWNVIQDKLKLSGLQLLALQGHLQKSSLIKDNNVLQEAYGMLQAAQWPLNELFEDPENLLWDKLRVLLSLKLKHDVALRVACEKSSSGQIGSSSDTITIDLPGFLGRYAHQVGLVEPDLNPDSFVEYGKARSRMTVSPEESPTAFIGRQPAINTLLDHAENIFSGRHLHRGFNKQPVCIEFGAPGSGKTELFLRLLMEHGKLSHVYSNSKPHGQHSKTQPEECLTLVVSFSGECTYAPAEHLLLLKYADGVELLTAVALRLLYQWLCSTALSYSGFLEVVREHVRSNWNKTFELGPLVQMILQRANKQRAILCLDETMLFAEQLKSSRRGIPGTDDPVVLQLRTLTNAQNEMLAVCYSTLDLKEFSAEVTTSARQLVRVCLPLLPQHEVATEMFDVLLRHDDELNLLCGSRVNLLNACAKLSGGYPRAVMIIANIINQQPAPLGWASVIQAVGNTARGPEAMSELTLDLVLCSLSQNCGDILTRERIDDLIRKGIFHSDEVDHAFMPHFFILQFVFGMLKTGIRSYGSLRPADKEILNRLHGLLASLEKPEGKGWEYLVANVECVRPAVRSMELRAFPEGTQWNTCTMKELYAIESDQPEALVFTVSDPLNQMLFNFTGSRKLLHYDKSLSEFDVATLLQHVFIPKDKCNKGFDFAMFYVPERTTSTRKKKLKKEDLVVVLTECKYSHEASTNKIDWSADLTKKRADALQEAENCGFSTERVIFRLMAWRASTSGERTDFPENVIVCNRETSKRHLGPTLAHLFNVAHESA